MDARGRSGRNAREEEIQLRPAPGPVRPAVTPGRPVPVLENKNSADIITWREYEALRNEMRREFRTQDDEVRGTVQGISQKLDATSETVTTMKDQMTDIQRFKFYNWLLTILHNNSNKKKQKTLIFRMKHLVLVVVLDVVTVVVALLNSDAMVVGLMKKTDWDNEYETGDDVDPYAPEDDDYDTDGVDAYPSDAHTIVVSQRALNVLPSASTQRCNLFQIKASVGPDKACKVIIDGGSCRNLASKELCTKLKLKYLPHPHPYYIQWLSDNDMASSINFNQFLEKEKLKSNGSNFTDWFRHVRIFLNGGNLQYVLDAPLGDPPAETETDEVKNVYMTRKTRYSQVQCAILCSLESDLQKRFEHHDPHELIKELKTIFETHAAVECYEASKHFFSCMMEEGSSISEHMLVMTRHAKKLSDLGIVIPNRLGINRVLQSLPPSYKNFVMNYNMQNMNKEFPELFGMLKAAEIEIKKEHQVLMVNKTTSFKKQGKSKGKNKKSGKKAATPPVKPKSGPKPDAECYYCKEKGHWKRNCSKYLADLKSGLVKKKKEGISDIHELKNKRQLLKDEVTMRVGNGSKVNVIAVGTLPLHLPSGLVLSLNNCYYVPALSMNIISGSCLMQDACLMGKMTKTPFSGMMERATDLLEIIHTDVCGPMSVASRGGYRYVLTFTDDLSRYGYIYLMKHKSETFEKFKEFQSEVENQRNKKIKFLRSDRGGEYLSYEFSMHLKKCGILSQLTPPGTPQRNGVSERRNRTLLDMTAAFTLNRAPSKSVETTPYELWFNKKPKLSFLKVWGCEAYVKKLQPDKLEPKAEKCVFIGYPKETIGYTFYHRSEGKIFVAKNGTFLEKEFLTKEVTGRKVELDEIEESLLVDQSSAVPENVPVPTPATEEANDNDHETSNETATEPRRSTRDRATPDWYDPCLNVMIVDNNDEDPATYEEAMMSPDSNKWQEAMKSEMGSMYDNKVWTLVDLPDSRKAVENKWIFKRKTDADGNITVYKARLVAKGFRQIQGVDYDETFSPVAKLKSVRILLAIAAFFDYEIWQMDVKTAFLNGDIEEELYMESHAGGLMGHFGREKTLLMLADHFYWPKMRQDVDRYEEEASIARGGEEQLDQKMDVKLDMKTYHGRARWATKKHALSVLSPSTFALEDFDVAEWIAVYRRPYGPGAIDETTSGLSSTTL
ncbi:hypothetical protein QYE76_045947 [Lolium multiflorum]|uniref:Gag-pol polyprotein n=1 Tax=Lolium multiflorum TaxID=4521 RepID=A0AAD8WYQ6_LOLMU|nr:hypothetical protein QYE76_045947 [Lolium multiflorum]